jgi:RNA polymerase subunit RPABC4/transcription elongation factor Spt4
METYKSFGTIKIYYCKACPGIYTKERSCPSCNTDNQEIGWVENKGVDNE